MDDGIRDGRCLRCPLAVIELVEREAQTYRETFRLVPSFRIGLHGGSVVSGECGDNKREIVLFGDTVNTAAGLVDSAKELRHPVVISRSLLDHFPDVGEADITHLGPTPLRGQSDPVDVAAVYPAWRQEAELPYVTDRNAAGR